jgi:single-strand DNA-binding protein
MNKVMIVGRLTSTPNMSSTQSGKSVLDFTIASKRGSNRKKTDFIKCVAWERLAELISQYSKKGDRIVLTGEWQTETFERPDGTKGKSQELCVQEVEFVEPKGEADNGYYPDEETPEYFADDDMPM